MSRIEILRKAFAGLCLLGSAGAPVAHGASGVPDQAAPSPLPAVVVSEIRRTYVAEGMETRYLDASVDLNGDGKEERLVYLVGGMPCGTGGCALLVFTPQDDGYRLVSTVGLTRPPIRVAKTVTRGWRNLVVHVSGGGQRGRDVEVSFDGKTYPENPSVRGPHVKTAAAGAAGDTVIADFESFTDTKPLP